MAYQPLHHQVIFVHFIAVLTPVNPSQTSDKACYLTRLTSTPEKYLDFYIVFSFT